MYANNNHYNYLFVHAPIDYLARGKISLISSQLVNNPYSTSHNGQYTLN